MNRWLLESKECLAHLGEQMQSTAAYFLRMRMEALPQTFDVRLTPGAVEEAFMRAQKNSRVARARLYRIAVRMVYALAYRDSVAWELACRDLFELGKVG